MIETWRWFGPSDPVSLTDIRQTGATGIVTALHELPNGAVWSIEAIAERRQMIEAAGLSWEVVESIPVHEDIKTGAPGWENYAEAWAQSALNIAACGIHRICYNFMPVLDWTRTDLDYVLPDGATCLRFDNDQFAAFDIHILQRPGAAEEHGPELSARAAACFAQMDRAAQDRLTRTIIAGLPGSEESFTLESFRAQLARYDGIDHDQLRRNLAQFLQLVVPRLEKAGVVLGMHPDDPPRPLFGLPRIVSTAEDLRALLAMIDSPSNGLTFCTGSLGVRADNDLPAMLREFGHRVHFLHLRSTSREADPASFHEAPHLTGDVNMVAVLQEALAIEARRQTSLPFRPDHGHAMADDQRRKTAPGYPLIGRLRGLAELRGVLQALRQLAA
ncbi:MAG: mannonate dehydratase [Mangrovicoccus sp.]